MFHLLRVQNFIKIGANFGASLMHPALTKSVEDVIITYTLQTAQSKLISFLSFSACLKIKWLFIATCNTSYIKAYFVKGRSYKGKNYRKPKLNLSITITSTRNCLQLTLW